MSTGNISDDDRENLPRKQAMTLALQLLARREHSRKELVLKLHQRHFREQVIDSVLNECEAQNWLSDDRFAESFARQRLDAGYGEVRIRAELQQRGIEVSDLLKSVFADHDGASAAAVLRVRHFGGDLPEGEADRARQWRYLQQRGYTSEQIRQALKVVELISD